MNVYQAQKFAHWDGIMAPQSIMKAIGEHYTSNNNTWSEQTFFFPNATVFDEYNKYAAIVGLFGGYAMKEKAEDIIFGMHLPA